MRKKKAATKSAQNPWIKPANAVGGAVRVVTPEAEYARTIKALREIARGG